MCRRCWSCVRCWAPMGLLLCWGGHGVGHSVGWLVWAEPARLAHEGLGVSEMGGEHGFDAAP